MKLFLEPEDVWLFRDGRPFDAASSHRARSLFPPYPTVLQGVIRSHELILKGVDLGDKQAITQAVGTAEDFGSLRMRGPFLAMRNGKDTITRYFPRPADWFPVSEGGDQIHALLPDDRPADASTSASAEDLPLLLFPGNFQPGKKEYGEWLSEKDLGAYLKGDPVIPVKSSILFVRESRVGVQLEGNSRAAKQGMLYEAEFIRPSDGAGLYVEVEGYDPWPQTGMFRMGGESHAARFQQVCADDWPQPPESLPERFKVYFASPAYFKKGWRPERWEQFFEGKVELMAVALKGYEVVGGFDYLAGSDKASRRYIPAGSVYFFEAKVQTRLKQNFLTEAGAEIGFGQILVDGW